MQTNNTCNRRSVLFPVPFPALCLWCAMRGGYSTRYDFHPFWQGRERDTYNSLTTHTHTCAVFILFEHKCVCLSSHNPLISDLGYLVTRDFFNSFLNCISMHRVFPSEQQKIEIGLVQSGHLIKTWKIKNRGCCPRNKNSHNHEFNAQSGLS